MGDEACAEIASLKAELKRMKTENDRAVIGNSHIIGKRRPTKKRGIDHIDPENEQERSICEEKKDNKPDKIEHNEAAPHQSNNGIQIMKEIMRAELEEFAYQNKERKRRSNNVIIHGLIERKEIGDKTQIEKIFKAVNVEPNPKSFTRLGFDSESSNTRPITMVMRSKRHKTLFMKNFHKLKTVKASQQLVRNDEQYFSHHL